MLWLFNFFVHCCSLDVDCYSVFFMSFEELVSNTILQREAYIVSSMLVLFLQLAEEIKKHLAQCCELDETASLTYELYRAVKGLVPLATDVNPR